MVADEMRGDVFNERQVKTPHPTELADKGITFTRAYTVNPVCSPSRCCMFTGQYPHNGGHRSLYQLLRPHEENLFHLFKSNGYDVTWIGRNDLFTKEAARESVTRRIDNRPEKLKELYRLAATGKAVAGDLEPYIRMNPFPQGHPWRKSFYYGERTEQQAEYDYDKHIMEKAIEYLEEYGRSNRESPFCLYVAFASPHPPYTVEEPYFSMYERNKIKLTLPSGEGYEYDDKPEFIRLIRQRYGLNNLNKEDFREIRAVYYGMISKLDFHIGRILEKLAEMDLSGDTVVCYISDHGDYTGDHGLVEKWHTGMHDCLLNVPLVLSVPGLTTSRVESDAMVETIDIFPSLLELTGIESPYTHFGKSLIPLMKGEVAVHRESVFAEGGCDPREPQCSDDIIRSPDDLFGGIYFDKTDIPKQKPETICRTAMVRSQEWKLVIRSSPSQVDELYNLQDDPGELINLISKPEHAGRVLELRNMLLNWYLRTSDNPHWEHRREI